MLKRIFRTKNNGNVMECQYISMVGDGQSLYILHNVRDRDQIMFTDIHTESRVLELGIPVYSGKDVKNAMLSKSSTKPMLAFVTK